MKVFVGQIYAEPGVNFPFSHRMQVWLGERLSSLVAPANGFLERYGQDFNLVVRVSARTKIDDIEVVGPTVFKKTKDVEYTLFLPYDPIRSAQDGCQVAVNCLLTGIQTILAQAAVSAPALETGRDELVQQLCTDPLMLKAPWPARVVR